MKKILICLVAFGLFGCSENTRQEMKQRQEQEAKYKTKTCYSSGDIRVLDVEIEGHQYIIFDGYYSGNIIHAAHCPCHDKK